MSLSIEASRTEMSSALLPDAWRVEVFRRSERADPEGEHLAGALEELGIDARGPIRVGKGYLLSPRYTREEVAAIVAEVLADPVVDAPRIVAPQEAPGDAPGDAPGARGARHRVLVAPKPGVMDPVARTLDDLFRRSGRTPGADASQDAGVASYRVLELAGDLSQEDLATASARVFGNETIETILVDREDLPYGAAFPQARRGRVEVPLLGADDAELERTSRDGGLSLSLVEMRRIQEHFRDLGREPSACELETLAQTWSEHCKHKTLTGRIEIRRPDGRVEEIDNLLRSTIAKATRELDREWCVSVFVDNAGIVEFADGWDLAIKVETHNHPSAIDPYGGAGTGIGGVIRDVLGAGLGAKPIANTDCFFVGPPDLPRESVPRGTMHPRRILRGIVAGVRDYGNRMGIPTVNGGVWFDERYTANPLVYAGTVGILPHDCAEKEVRPGDVIVAVGGRTGRDGIHGATFSSIELSEESEMVSSAAVQIGDPVTEKRVLDCQLEARDRRLYRAVTDCGAGGFSSAVGEMGEHTGAEVELADVPLKYAGLSSHEIWISEAQERMVLAVPPEKLDQLVGVFAAEDVEATVIGRFTDDARLVVKDGGEVVCDLDMGFLHRGTPRPLRRAEWSPPELADPGVPAPAGGDWSGTIRALLASPNIASKEWIVRQYDHEVQGATVVKPLVGEREDGPGDAAVLRPLPDSQRGVAIACGTNPFYGSLDPYAMALAAIDEALRNAVAVGADPDRASLLDNFSWGNCDKPDRLGSLVLAADACYDAAIAFRTPFISGKDSLNNEYRVGDRTLAIPPTLLITTMAIVPDVAHTTTMDWKAAGNGLWLVGSTACELGGSHYLAALGLGGGRVPRPDLETAPALFAALHAAIAGGLVASCHDLSEGGLAVAAAESAFAGGIGGTIDLAEVPVAAGADGADGDQADDGDGVDPDALRLFSESTTRFLVEVAPGNEDAFAAALAERGAVAARVGRTGPEATLTFHATAGGVLCSTPLEELRQAFHSGFRG